MLSAETRKQLLNFQRNEITEHHIYHRLARLRYIGSVVLGLNEALIELTGALAGLTLALQNTRLIALTGAT